MGRVRAIQDRRRVLLVEGDALDARVVTAILESQGVIDVLHAATLGGARSRLAAERFDLVIADLTLPDSAGMATFDALREAGPTIPTVILSSMADELTALRAVWAGARGYVLKRDVDVRTLDRALRTAVAAAAEVSGLTRREAVPGTGDTRLRNVLDNVATFVAVFSLDGVVLDVNRAPLAAGGLDRQSVVGQRFADMPWWSHSHIERARVIDAIARAAAGETLRFDTHVRRMRGGIMHVDACFAPLRDDAGQIVQVVGSGVDITGRKQAEQALARSQAQLAEAQRLAHVGSWEWDVVSNSVTWSDELYRINGIDRSAFEGTYEGFLSRVHPDDRAHTTEVIARSVREGTPFFYEHRVVRPDGTSRMMRTQGDAIRDDSGELVRLVGSCWDVSERWEATRALEWSVAALTATLEAAADGFVVVNRDDEITAANPQVLALWGLEPEALDQGTAHLLQRVTEQVEDSGRFLARLQELRAQPDASSFDVVRLKDGRVIERYSQPQRVRGETCGRVISFRDVTQRERLLIAAEQAREEAERARHELLSILERVSDGFVALDCDWRIRYVNENGARLLRRTSDELIGKHAWTEFPCAPRNEITGAHENPAVEQAPVQLKQYSPHWDRWFEARVYPAPDGVSIFFADVTNQQRAEDRLQASREQLRALGARMEEIREEERRLMAREIHDQIGQSLTSLKLELAWVHSHLTAASAGETQRRLRAMTALVDDTMETARRLSSELRPAILDDLGLGAAVEWRAHDLERRTGIRCEVTLPPEEEERRLDRPRALALFRILQEALTNVVRHAKAQRVIIDLALDGPAAVLIVRDDGRGATKAALESATAFGVLGMKERARPFEGEVKVEGQQGEGTTVTVFIPLRDETAPAQEA